MKTLQRPCLKVFSLILDIKAGFDNVDNSTLARILREGGISTCLVSWVSSFLSERSCTLVFQGAPGTPAQVNVGAPQGSPISPVLFLLYILPLHFKIPQGLMISYGDDLARTAASHSYRGKIRRLQELFERLEVKARRLAVSFSIAKTELIHWRTPSQRYSPKCRSPIQIKGELFRPYDSLRWLGYWFTPRGSLRSLLPETGPCAGGLRPYQTPQPFWDGPSPIPVPQARNIPGRPHTTIRGRPLHTQRGRHSAPQHLLA